MGLIFGTEDVMACLIAESNASSPESISMLFKFLSWGSVMSLTFFVAVMLKRVQLVLLKLNFISGESVSKSVKSLMVAVIFSASWSLSDGIVFSPMFLRLWRRIRWSERQRSMKKLPFEYEGR